MGDMRNGPIANWIAVTTAVTMIVLTVMMLVTSTAA
jgi:Mn2+/Fe2+ NRAMP family transporter